jgi:hypothetical protein
MASATSGKHGTPAEGKRITHPVTTILNDGDAHGDVGSSCACCFADFEAANYVEYQAKEVN